MATDIKQLPNGGDTRRRHKAKAGISLPVIAFQDKPASRVTPDDVRQSRNPVRFAKVGTDTVLRGELPKDATRQDPTTQLRALKAAIEHNLKRVVSLVKRGEFDRAQIVCSIVAQQRGTAIGLADKLATAMALEAQAAKDMPARKPTIAVTVKQKRYNRWSEK
mgnify:CR=1 FL=1